jgi:hypothetical protein
MQASGRTGPGIAPASRRLHQKGDAAEAAANWSVLVVQTGPARRSNRVHSGTSNTGLTDSKPTHSPGPLTACLLCSRQVGQYNEVVRGTKMHLVQSTRKRTRRLKSQRRRPDRQCQAGGRCLNCVPATHVRARQPACQRPRSARPMLHLLVTAYGHKTTPWWEKMDTNDGRDGSTTL